jgi:peptide/nickel transport system substrate-binding protein
MVIREVDELYRSATTTAVNRRTFLMRAAALGAGSTVLGGLLAACGDEDVDGDADTGDDEGAGDADAAAEESGDDEEDEEGEEGETVEEPESEDETEGDSEVSSGGELTIAISVDPQTLDPHRNSASSNTIFMHALFDHLIERSPDGTLYPGLATDWEVADDGVTWTLNLRDDVTFHDGTPFNAEAAVYSFERIVDPDTRSEYAVFQLGPYDSSSAIDEYTLELIMSEPYGLLPVSLATYGMAMVSPEAAEAAGEEFAQQPVGSGPFMFEEMVQQSHTVFVRNPDYNWGSPINEVEGPAPLERVTFQTIPEDGARAAALFSGEVDMAEISGVDFNDFESDEAYRTQKVLTEGYPPAGLFINVDRFPTDDLLVRQALAFGVDRHEVNDIVYDGHAEDADSVMSPFSWAYDSESALYEYDPERAGELLDEAGWVMGDGEFREKDGEELRIVHLALTSVRNVAEVVQSQLARIGVNAELLVQDNPAQQQSGQEGVHNLVWTQWSGVDPGDLWKIYRSSEIGSGWNFAHYNNPELDELFDEGAAENDEEARKEIYSRIQMMLMEDATFIPLNNRTVFFAMTTNVRGTDVIDERGSWGRLYNFYVDEE